MDSLIVLFSTFQFKPSHKLRVDLIKSPLYFHYNIFQQYI